jgi:hypothetical protein
LFIPYVFPLHANKGREAFTLHEHSISLAAEAGHEEGIARATIALQSLVRTVIQMTKLSAVGRPLDWDSISFWAHGAVSKAAVWHIKLGERNDEWQSDLKILKNSVRWLAPRYKIYGMQARREGPDTREELTCGGNRKLFEGD